MSPTKINPHDLELHPSLAECLMMPLTHPDCLKIRESILEHGWTETIKLGPDGRVIDGAHRLAVAIDMGLDEVPVERLEVDAWAYVLASDIARKNWPKWLIVYRHMGFLRQLSEEGKAARSENMKIGKNPNVSRKAQSGPFGGVKGWLEQSGIDDNTYKRALIVWKKCREISGDRRAEIEGKMLSGELTLEGAAKAVGAVLTYEQGRVRDLGERRREYARLALEAAARLMKPLSHWQEIGKVEREEVASGIADAVAAWPEEVRAAVKKVL